MKLRRADSSDLSRIAALLRANSLPTIGIERWYENFFIACDETGCCVGVAGYEAYGRTALLRSVAVKEESRGQGHDRALVEAIMADARRRRVHTIYLLTETAEDYFSRLGFVSVDRDRIAQEVKSSAEFTDCCTTVQAMRRTL